MRRIRRFETHGGIRPAVVRPWGPVRLAAANGSKPCSAIGCVDSMSHCGLYQGGSLSIRQGFTDLLENTAIL